MTQRQFVNGLRILNSIDHAEVPFLDAKRWQAFSSDPHRFLMRADDATVDAIWAVIERRHAGRVA